MFFSSQTKKISTKVVEKNLIIVSRLKMEEIIAKHSMKVVDKICSFQT